MAGAVSVHQPSRAPRDGWRRGIAGRAGRASDAATAARPRARRSRSARPGRVVHRAAVPHQPHWTAAAGASRAGGDERAAHRASGRGARAVSDPAVWEVRARHLSNGRAHQLRDGEPAYRGSTDLAERCDRSAAAQVLRRGQRSRTGRSRSTADPIDPISRQICSARCSHRLGGICDRAARSVTATAEAARPGPDSDPPAAFQSTD